MLPDASVYDSTNARSLLVWCLRQKKIVLGFSENVVKAGAYAGQYGRSEDLGRQTGQLVMEILKGKDPAKIGWQYADSAGRSVNLRTADMIDKPFSEALLDKSVLRFGNEE